MNLDKKSLSNNISAKPGFFDTKLFGKELKFKPLKKNPRKKKDIKALVIDLGSSNIKFAVGQKVGDKIRVEKIFSREIAPNIYDNGHILNADELKLAIKNAIEENSVSVTDTICTVQSSELILRELVLPSIEDEDISQMIEYEIGQYLPIDVDSFILQHKVIRRFEEDEVMKMEVLVGAFSKEIVDPIYKILNECGLTPVVMDIHFNCVNKLLNFTRKKEIAVEQESEAITSAMIDIGYNSINITIAENGIYKFNRTIKSGLSSIEHIISSHNTLTPQEARIHRNNLTSKSIIDLEKSFENTNENLYLIEDKNDLNFMTINDYLTQLNEWTDEMDKIFKYYTSRSTNNTIDGIYVYGGGSALEDIDKFFEQKLSIPAYSLKAIEGIEFSNNDHSKQIPLYINAIGSLIRE